MGDPKSPRRLYGEREVKFRDEVGTESAGKLPERQSECASHDAPKRWAPTWEAPRVGAFTSIPETAGIANQNWCF